MAKFYNNESDLDVKIDISKKNMNNHVKKAFIAGFSITPIIYICSVINKHITHFSVSDNVQYIFMISAMLYVLYQIYSFSSERKSLRVIEVGAEGEKKAQMILRYLPETYSIIPNIVLQFGNKRSEMDVVVIGPNGVCIVETKAYSGEIRGNTSEHNISRVKLSNAGQEFITESYNPVKQVATHKYTLSNVLREKGYNVWVNSCVYFSNKDTTVSVINDNNCDTPIFCAKNGYQNMLNYITSQKSDTILNEETIKKIISIIKYQQRAKG